MPEDSDLPGLIQRARQGDMEAFGELVKRFGAAVRAMCLLRAPDSERADDISQQVFLTAWQRLPSMNAGLVFWPWLEGITRNHLFNEWRRVQRERGFRQRYTVAWLAEQETGESAAEDAETLLRQMESLRSCLDGLPANLRQMVKLRYDEGCSSEKIATQLGRSADAVRQTFVRLREKLRGCIEQRMNRGSAV